MSASGLTAADPVTATSCVAAAAAVALLEDETDRDPQVSVVESSNSAEELPAALESISGGEKRPREEEGDVGADSSNEEPPTKKAADEGEQPQETGNEAEVTRNAIEMKRSAGETAPGINGAPPIGSSISAIPFGPAAPDRPLDHHRWGAEAGPFRHTLKVPQHCVAQIIGRGGANLTSIRNTSRCHIECDQYTKEQGYSLFHIDGQNDEDLQRAIRAIERQTKPMEPLEGEIQHIIQVPDDRVGDILGPRGCVVKVIADRTGCRIDMQQRGLQRGEARACRIIGTPAEVQAGVKMVEGIRDNLIDVKALIREFEELNPNFRRDESELRSPAGWGSGGKGSGGWDQSYGMRTEYVAHAPYGAFGGQDPWSHLLPASGPIDRAVIDVPAECAGLVIGRGGENVKGLKSQCSLSECQIEKGVDQRTPRKMTLQGPASGVQAALMQLSMKTNGRIVTIVQQQYPNYQPQPQGMGPQGPMMQQQPHSQGYNAGIMPPPSQQGYGMMMQGGGGGGTDPMAQYYSQWAAYQQQVAASNQANMAAWSKYYASMGYQLPPS